MTKIDELISKFQEFKEELNKAICPYTHKDAKLCPKDCPCKEDVKKNVNMSYSSSPNSATGMPATMGTSGGQGGMYRSEHMDKQAVAPTSTMNLSDDEDSDMRKQMVSASPGGAQDMRMIKYDKNGQWRLDKGERKDTKHDRCARKVAAKGNVSNPHAVCVAAGVEPEKWKKSVDLAEGIIEVLEKNYESFRGKNREANPKLRQSDLGPGGKVHVIRKDEGTNEEANPAQPHNKGKFKVMPMATEKEQKRAGASGLPYNGKDKDVKKNEECPKCKKDPCECPSVEKAQGNEAKGFDENKAPGRGTLSV